MKQTIRKIRIAVPAIALLGVLAVNADAQHFSTSNPMSQWSSPSGTYQLAAYMYDDGSSENSLGLTAGGEMAWMHHFPALAGMNTIGSIEFTLGTTTGSNPSLLGSTANVAVYDDPTNDGNPSDAVLLTGPIPFVVTNSDDDVFMSVSFPGTNVNGTFFILTSVTHPAGEFPASMDTAQASLGRAWVVGSTSGPFNFANLNLNNVPPTEMDSINFPSVFLLRGEVGGTPTTSFCTAKTGLVCGTPSISANGTSSVAMSSGYTISAGPARSNKSGILIYNTSLLASGVPFQGGTLCVEAMGLRRAGSTNSMGTGGGGAGPCTAGPSTCDGIFTIDMNAFAAGAWAVPACDGSPSGTAPNNPAPFLSVMGTNVSVQYWGRDSVATGSFVSDGLTYPVGP